MHWKICYINTIAVWLAQFNFLLLLLLLYTLLRAFCCHRQCLLRPTGWMDYVQNVPTQNSIEKCELNKMTAMQKLWLNLSIELIMNERETEKKIETTKIYQNLLFNIHNAETPFDAIENQMNCCLSHAITQKIHCPYMCMCGYFWKYFHV